MITGILRSIGIAAVCVAITVLYYEGLRLPFVGQVIDGAIAHRLDAYVVLVEKTAADAAAKEIKRQSDASKAVADNFQKQLTIAAAAEAKAQTDLEKGLAQYEQRLADAKRQCLLDNDDVSTIILHNGAGKADPIGKRKGPN